MAKRYITLNKEDQFHLKRAIELAAEKFIPGSKYPDLGKEQKDNLGEAIGVGRQTLDTYYNGGEQINCYPKNLNSICERIDGSTWAVFLEKSRAHSPASKSIVSGQDEKVSKTQKKYWLNRKSVIAGIILIPFLFCIYYITKQVSTTAIDGQMIASSVSFTLTAQTRINKIEAREYIRFDSAIWYGIPVGEGLKNKLSAYALNDQEPVALEQLIIPAGVRVTVDNPTKGQLLITLLAGDEDVKVEGQIVKFNTVFINKTERVDKDAFINNHTKVVSFAAHLKRNEKFEFAMVNAGPVDIPWILIRDIRFQEKDDFFSSPRESSIIQGSIVFTQTAEKQKVEAFDVLLITQSNPLRMMLSFGQDGIHCDFSGDVNQVSLGSVKMNRKAKNFMPRAYAIVLAIFPDWVWLILISLIGLIPVFSKMIDHVKKVMR